LLPYFFEKLKNFSCSTFNLCFLTWILLFIYYDDTYQLLIILFYNNEIYYNLTKLKKETVDNLMKHIAFLIAFCCTSLLAGFSSLAQNADSYTLNPGDQLHISVWREETLDKEVTVLPDGRITFPLIGSVDVVGVSSIELEEIIEEKLSETIPGAEVTVLVLAVNGNRVFVIGKALRPGEFVMNSKMTVAQVLSLAGGLDRFADGNSIKVQRIEGGNIRYFEYNFDDLLSGEVKDSMGFILKAGDVVIVP